MKSNQMTLALLNKEEIELSILVVAIF